jgi:hypothetical protein
MMVAVLVVRLLSACLIFCLLMICVTLEGECPDEDGGGERGRKRIQVAFYTGQISRQWGC